MNNALDSFDFMQRKKIRRLMDTLQEIVDVYDMKEELFTNDKDVAANLYDRAKLALYREG